MVIFCQLRSGTLCLAIESGRCRNVSGSKRLWKICNIVGDEIHFLFDCTLYQELKEKLIRMFSRTEKI